MQMSAQFYWSKKSRQLVREAHSIKVSAKANESFYWGRVGADAHTRWDHKGDTSMHRLNTGQIIV
jgi:hypothetical protein